MPITLNPSSVVFGSMYSVAVAMARNVVRASARNARDRDVYSDFDVDLAIMAVGERFSRFTQSVKTSTTLALTAGSQAVPAMPSGFHPDHLERAFLDDLRQTELQIVSDAELSQIMRYCGSLAATPQTGIPRWLAFSSQTTARIFPAPDAGNWPADASLNLILRWWQEFNTWTAGTEGTYSNTMPYRPGEVVDSGGNLYQAIQPNTGQSVSNTTYWTPLGTGTLDAPADIMLNIPGGWLIPILGDGAAAKLMENLKENSSLAAAKWTAYLDFENRMRGVGTLAGKDVHVGRRLDTGEPVQELFL